MKHSPDTWPEPLRYGELHAEREVLLREQARQLGWDVVSIDLDGCETKRDLLERLAAAFDFPVWFGGNWDALFDCLADLGWRAAAGHLLLLRNASTLRDCSPEAFGTAIVILGDAATAQQSRGRSLRVWVDAAAPGRPLQG